MRPPKRKKRKKEKKKEAIYLHLTREPPSLEFVTNSETGRGVGNLGKQGKSPFEL